MDLTNIRTELEQKRGELANLWAKFDTKGLPDGTQAPVMTADDLLEFKNRTAEIDGLGSKLNILEAAQKAAAPVNPLVPDTKHQDSGKPGFPGLKGLTKALSDKPLSLNGEGVKFALNLAEMKATVTTSSGYAPESVRTGQVVDSVYARPTILDFIGMLPWDQAAYVYMAETTRTNATVPATEVAAATESTLIWTEQTTSLETIPAYLPVSEKSMRYSAELRRLVEVALPKMVMQVMGSQVLTGDGSSPNLRGLNNVTGVQSEALGANPRLTAILNAMVNVMRDDSTTYGGGNPNLVVLNPTDWQQVMDSRTTDGQYIIGDPANRNPFGQTLWGLIPIITAQQTSGTGLVLDSSFFDVVYNDVAQLEFTNSHGELFANRVTVFRSTIDAALVSRRGAAVCKVTGI